MRKLGWIELNLSKIHTSMVSFSVLRFLCNKNATLITNSHYIILVVQVKKYVIYVIITNTSLGALGAFSQQKLKIIKKYNIKKKKKPNTSYLIFFLIKTSKFFCLLITSIHFSSQFGHCKLIVTLGKGLKLAQF